MPEPIPNVPLRRCEAMAKAARVTAEAARKKPSLSGDHVHTLLLKIADHLDELAIMIQQDQSGEI